jgi:1-acyl-sn-glycerol-3-phosphate acyltransferase
MTLARTAVNVSLRAVTDMLCRIEDKQMSKIPLCGPLLLVTNHVNFLEAPVLITRIQPRPLTGFVKVETWDNPLMGKLFNIWGGIPVHRGTPDREALRSGLKALNEGYILGVTPEGTRSGDGILQKGNPGIVSLALRSGAPILPLAFYGGELFWDNVRRLKRTNFYIVVGNSFKVQCIGTRATREIREAILDEIMYQLAALLPARYRGVYANLDQATNRQIVFSDPAMNNLNQVTSYK